MNKNLLIHIQSPPKEASFDSLVKYFSQYGKVVNLRFFKGDYFKDPTAFLSFSHSKNGKNQNSSGINTSTPNSALLECSSKAMKEAILNNVHFFANKAIRVRRYMEEKELIQYIKQIRYTRIFVDNIPKYLTNEQLKEFFENFGPVKSAYITGDGKQSSKTKFGYVIFEDAGVVETLNRKGLKFNNTVLLWSSYYFKNQSVHSGKRHLHNKEKRKKDKYNNNHHNNKNIKNIHKKDRQGKQSSRIINSNFPIESNFANSNYIAASPKTGYQIGSCTHSNSSNQHYKPNQIVRVKNIKSNSGFSKNQAPKRSINMSNFKNQNFKNSQALGYTPYLNSYQSFPENDYPRNRLYSVDAFSFKPFQKGYFNQRMNNFRFNSNHHSSNIVFNVSNIRRKQLKCPVNQGWNNAREFLKPQYASSSFQGQYEQTHHYSNYRC